LSSFGIVLTIKRKNMTISKFKLEDFESEKLSKKEQKTIHGGDDTDPAKTGGNGNGCF